MKEGWVNYNKTVTLLTPGYGHLKPPNAIANLLYETEVARIHVKSPPDTPLPTRLGFQPPQAPRSYLSAHIWCIYDVYAYE